MKEMSGNESELAPTDPVQVVRALGGLISGDMKTCVLCEGTCICASLEFGTPEYFAHTDRAHGRRNLL